MPHLLLCYMTTFISGRWIVGVIVEKSAQCNLYIKQPIVSANIHPARHSPLTVELITLKRSEESLGLLVLLWFRQRDPHFLHLSYSLVQYPRDLRPYWTVLHLTIHTQHQCRVCSFCIKVKSKDVEMGWGMSNFHKVSVLVCCDIKCAFMPGHIEVIQQP